MRLTEADIQPQLTRRRPGQSRLTTPRNETDVVTILSGTERGVTLGTPIALLVPNENVRPGDYAEMADVPRPGHADYTYQAKYGVRAGSGGGRSSARETIGRVAAGAIAEKWLAETYGTLIVTFVSAVGTVELAAEHGTRPDGTPYSREDVDELGTLTILRDAAAGWTRVVPADAAAQAVLDAADEAAFVAAYTATSADCASQLTLCSAAAPSSVSPPSQAAPERASPAANDAATRASYSVAASTPAYEDAAGYVYNMHGGLLAGAQATDACRTQEVIAVRCPHAPTAARMASLIRAVKAASDSTGGVLTTVVTRVPVGLGEPVFDKLPAMLAHAMLSLPAVKGFEIGDGFTGTRLRGSAHNDAFRAAAARGADGSCPAAADPSLPSLLLRTATNHAGGTLGGVSSGANLLFRVAIKPVSTIGRPQVTATYGGAAAVLEAKGRHDPCVLPRSPPLVEAMTAIVLADSALVQRSRGTEPRVLPDEDMEYPM